MAKLSYRFSYRILYVLFAVILVVLGLFYFVGYNNMVGDRKAPENTDALIYLMYAMVTVAFIMFFVGKFIHLVSLLRHEPKTGLRFLAFDVLLVALLIITYGVASSNPMTLTDGSVYTDSLWLKVTDMMLYSLFFLLAVAVIGTFLNLSGLFKKIK